MLLSFDQIRDAVRTAIKAGRPKNDYVYMRETYPGYAIYEYESQAGQSQLYRVAYSIDDTGKVTLQQAELVQEVRTYEPVKVAAYSLASFSDDKDGYVIRTGKVFELGDYPDKDFSLDEEEADTVTVPEFSPVYNDFEHRETLPSKKKALGQLVSVFRRGKDLIGSVRIPVWLNNMLDPGEALQVSLEFDRESKRIIGNAITLNPRIPDAALMAAFNDSRSGGSVMKDKEQGRIARMAAAVVAAVTAVFSGEPEIEDVGDGNGNAKPGDDALKAQVDQLQQQVADLTKKPSGNEAGATAEQAAKAFAAGLLAEGKLEPGEVEDFTASFCQAAADDNAGKAMFSADGSLNEGDRLARLKALFSGRKPSGMTTETIPANAQVLYSGDSNGTKKKGIDYQGIYNRRAGGKS